MNSADSARSVSQNASFFRASGWLILATTLSGACMFLVQIIARAWLSNDHYGLMGTLFQVLNLCMIPALGLQTVFAQQAAAASSQQQKSLLFTTAQKVLSATGFLWAIAALLLLAFQNHIATSFKSPSTLPLWITLAAALPQLWLPVWMGVLQGQQRFLWLGNGLIFNGIGRLAGAGILVGVCQLGVSGAVGAAFLGFAGAFAVCAMAVDRRELASPDETGESERAAGDEAFKWGRWIGMVAPLTLGLGASTFFLGYDMIVVRMKFPEGMTGDYAYASLFGRGLVIFTIPIAQVMFPRIVKLAGSRESSGAAGMIRNSLLATGGLAVIISAGVTVLCLGIKAMISGDWAWDPAGLRDRLQPEQLAMIANVCGLAPWFLWSMTPLCLANVLINQLMALRFFRYFPALVGVTVAYGVCLALWTPSQLIQVIHNIGLFSLLLLATAAFAVKRYENQRNQAK